ncbi:hypothetical protein M5K25_007860 [Dendrobium thyrsiflorum]|uniref:Uncharacterized protein n=1 Tax=Dendrobium thyrsiflorum TaxID=117978 RepID=A0ABD0VLZ6_DENTH
MVYAHKPMYTKGGPLLAPALHQVPWTLNMATDSFPYCRARADSTPVSALFAVWPDPAEDSNHTERKRETNSHKPPTIATRRGEGRRPKAHSTGAKTAHGTAAQKAPASHETARKQGKGHGSSRERENRRAQETGPQKTAQNPKLPPPTAANQRIKQGNPRVTRTENREATQETTKEKTSDHSTKVSINTSKDMPKSTSLMPQKFICYELAKSMNHEECFF